MRFWQRLIAVGLGGFFGGAAREGMELLFANAFPTGTVLINLSGTFISAFLVVLFAKKIKVAQTTADFVLVGVLGAYTTYSTAILDMVKLGQFWPGLGYILISLIGGVLMVYAARWLAGKVVAE